MNDPFWIKLVCKRCGDIYILEPGEPLSEFCGPCARRLGKRLQDVSQFGLNFRYGQQKEALNRAPWGNEGKDPGRVYSFLPGGRAKVK